jgi:hypothetical protein
MHFMNPQRGAHLGLKPKGVFPGPDGGSMGSGTMDAGDDSGIGSAQTGYAGPENGPFECDHCIHFDGQGTCNNPQVQADPEVQGKVDAEGCCNLYSPAQEGEAGGGESEEEGAMPGAGEQI